jgi:hypothetical protein
MTLHPAIDRAIDKKVRRTGEDRSNLENITALVVTEPLEGHLDGLEELKCLSWFEVSFWDHPDLAQLHALPELKSLRIDDSHVTSLEPLRGHPTLDSVKFPRCEVTDLSPVLDLPALRTISPGGNPLDEHSYRVILPGLYARGIRTIPDNYELREREYRMIRKLWARGWSVSVFHDIYGKSRMSRPGAENRHHGILVLCEDELEVVLAQPEVVDVESFWVAARTFWEARMARDAEEALKKRGP